MTFLDKNFEEHASFERKENHRKREAHFKYLQSTSSSNLLAALESGSAKQWHAFTISSKALGKLWSGLTPDEVAISHLLGKVLPDFGRKLAENIKSIRVSVIVFGGESTFSFLRRGRNIIAWVAISMANNIDRK